MIKEVDYMEFANDAAAQAAYVTSATASYTSQYPTQDDAHVKATSKYSTDFWPYYATDPTKSLTGDYTSNSWVTPVATVTNQRFHIDLGSAKIVTRIYYENLHNSGSSTTAGVKNFTLWGSNEATAFAELTYGTDTNWTQLTTAQSTFDEHTGSDAADPKYILVTNSTGYRYYALKFADNWGSALIMGVHRIELQTGGTVSLQSYSGSIRSEGANSLKGIASAAALNETLTRTLGTAVNLTGITQLVFDMYASRIGENIKIGIHDSGGTTSEITPKYYPEAVDQEQTTSTTSIELGKQNTDQIRVAQSFIMSGALTVTAVEVRRHTGTVGTPTGNWTLRIETNNVNKPSGTLANANATVTVTPPAEGSIVKGVFATPFALSAATTYWLVILCDNQATNVYWKISMATAAYASGGESISTDGGTTWSAVVANNDLYFRIYAQKPNLWQSFAWDLSAVTDANKDDIDSIIVTIVNADAANTFYIDNLHARKTRPVLIL